MPSGDIPGLPPGLCDFIRSGLSITVSSCNERRVPSIAKGVGCSLSEDRRRVTVLLFADQAEDVLRDLERHGRIAVCFSRPSTHQTVQLKGEQARCRPAATVDIAIARRCLDGLVEDLRPLGFPVPMLEAFFWRDPAHLVAVSFTPDGAFAQTPGPEAGNAIPVRDAARSA